MRRNLIGVLRRLLSPRYVAFGLLMVTVAAICITLGVWQVARFAQKRAENHDLRRNAAAAAAPLDTLLRPVGEAAAPDAARDNRFRTATVTGTYDAADQLLVRGGQVDDSNALVVLTPLRTGGAVLLVARGWIDADTTPTVTPSAPPTGRVNVRVRVQSADARSDRFGREPAGQVRSINATDAARRLGTAVYAGYGELLSRQPGTGGLKTLPPPDLSNPAGGAIEPQHLAYIAQWFLFAGLALAAPPVMARAESRRTDDEPAAEPDGLDEIAPAPTEPTGSTGSTDGGISGERARRARLADPYGAARRY